LHRGEELLIKAIPRRLGISWNTVKRALASDEPPRYQRTAKGLAVDALEPAIRVLLAASPDMAATVIAERVGWTRSIASIFRTNRSSLADDVCS